MPSDPQRIPTAGPGGEPAPAEAAVLVAALGFPTLAAWLYFIVLPPGPGLVVAYFLAKLVQFGLPVAWAGWWQREDLTALRPGRRGLGSGLASGAALAVGLLLGYAVALRGGELAAAAAPRVRARLETFGVEGLAGYLVLAVALAVVHSFLEEYYWRWFVYGRLRRRLRTGPALAIGSAGFTGHHVIVLLAFTGAASITVGLALVVAGAGALWAWQYERTGTLTAPWVSHVLADLAILAVGWEMVGMR